MGHLSNSNQPCPCGSGLKAKKCWPNHAAHAASFRRHIRTRQWGSLASLRQSTLEFVDDLSSTLGVSVTKDSVAGPYASQIPLQAIHEIHSRITKYFPRSDGSYKRLLVDAELQGGAGIYLGPRSPQSICSHIARHSIYCPKIWVPNPFCQIYVSGKDGKHLPSAQENPDRWKLFTIRNAIFLRMLRPWIEEGIVICAPALGWTEQEFYQTEIAPVAGQRLEHEPLDVTRAGTLDTLLESLGQVHPRLVPSLLEQLTEGELPPDLMEMIQKMAMTEGRFNKFDDTRGPREVMLHYGHGESLESAEMLARLVGGYTLPTGFQNEKIYRTKPSDLRHPFTDISLALGSYQFNFLNHTSLDFALEIRKDDRFNRLRTYLNRMWSASPEKRVDSGAQRINSIQDELGVEYRQYKEEWNSIETKLLAHVAAAGVPAYIGGTFAAGPMMGLLAASSTTLLAAIQSHFDRKKLRKHALSVFIDLDT